MRIDERFAEMRHLEHELVRIDDTALQVIDDDLLADRLRAHREDHQRHAAVLEELLRQEGEPTPATDDAFVRHAAGYLPALAAAADTADAARLVLAAELDLAERYEAATRSGVPEAAADLVDRHLDEDRRHVRELERYVAQETIPGQGHGGGAYNDTGGALGTGPGVGGRGRRESRRQ